VNTPAYQEIATDAAQYDSDEVNWAIEGDGKSPRRRLIRQALAPHIADTVGKSVLDVGCGQGWLCAWVAEVGGAPHGIDPSAKNIAAARRRRPDLGFSQISLEDFKAIAPFDVATVIMASEHFGDAEAEYGRIARLVKLGGKLVVLSGDHDVFTRPRFGYDIRTQPLEQGVTAIRADYGPQGGGVIHDIVRTPERTIQAAGAAGFVLLEHQPVLPTDWLMNECPQYREFEGHPLFHVMAFENQRQP
jgi:SAM-dependent methyltransferase